MNEKLLNSIEGKKRELDRNRPLSSSIVRNLEKEFTIAWTYNSNAIEGNTLSLQETEVVLNEGITIGGKTVNEHFEAINHKKGIEYVRRIVEKKINISEEVIRELHRIILSSIDDPEAGNYRKHNVRILGARHIPPQSNKIPKMMSNFIIWFRSNEYKLNTPQMAAELHYRFVMIHPFVDGNGRVARLIMNLFLMRNGYPPAIILKVDRKRYYRILNQGNMGDSEPFNDFIGRAIERSLILYLNSIKPDLSEDQMFISLREAAVDCEYSQEYLSLLARKGRLAAVKIGKDWMTTKEAIEEYIETKKR
ncbi:MAG: Fic family protein [Spirochaetales bacterium]|jgi:Fic family protein|nr:Fic family protein [Spirochaetales bacterium]